MIWISFSLLAWRISRPKYNIEMVLSLSEINLDDETIVIPGFDENGLLCTLSSEIKAPKYQGDPVDLLAYYDGKCVVIYQDRDNLELCFDGESTLNGVSLGTTASYDVNGTIVHSITENGEKCQNDKRWELKLHYECDNTVSDDGVMVPVFWKSSNCTVEALVKTPYLCEHPDFTKENVMNIKCIPKSALERGRLRDLY